MENPPGAPYLPIRDMILTSKMSVSSGPHIFDLRTMARFSTAKFYTYGAPIDILVAQIDKFCIR